MENLEKNNSTEEQDQDAMEDAAMIDDQAEAVDEEEESMESLMEMYEESFKRFAEGEVVTGKIISVDKDYVLVDIGYKSEGQIRITEFRNEEGNIEANLDDTVEVMVEWWDDENEVVVLSKEKAAKVKVWEAIKVAYDSDETVEGVITSRVKGGFSVDIGVQAFLPGSQADLRPIAYVQSQIAKRTVRQIEFDLCPVSSQFQNQSVITAETEDIDDGPVEQVVQQVLPYGAVGADQGHLLIPDAGCNQGAFRKIPIGLAD